MMDALELVISPVHATNYHVDQASGDDCLNDGSTWPKAFKTLQRAIELVE